MARFKYLLQLKALLLLIIVSMATSYKEFLIVSAKLMDIGLATIPSVSTHIISNTNDYRNWKCVMYIFIY